MSESGSALGPSGSGSITINNTTSLQPQDNLSLSCAARNIQGSIMLPYTETEIIIARVIHAFFTFSLISVGGSLNLIVIFLVAKYKKLRTISFGIALQIVASNLLAAVFITLFSLITAIVNRWIFTEYVCSIVGMGVYLTLNVKNSLMFIFIIDRLLSVFCPFAYPKYQTRTVIILSGIALVHSFLVSGIGYALDCYGFNPSTWQCGPSGDCNKNCSAYFGLNGSLFALGRILSLFLFGLLFMKARKANKEMATTAGSLGMQQSKYNWKATITFFMLFMSLFVFSIPSIAIFIIANIFYGSGGTSSTETVLNTAANYIISLLFIMDPIIILRNGDVREILTEIKAKIGRRFCHNANNAESQ